MAFIIKKEKSYSWPITIQEPVSGGQFENQKITVKFKMLSQSRIDDIVKNTEELDEDILKDVLIGWDDEAFKNEEGIPIPFTAENQSLILSVPFVRIALVKGFFASIAGKEIKRKN